MNSIDSVCRWLSRLQAQLGIWLVALMVVAFVARASGEPPFFQDRDRRFSTISNGTIEIGVDRQSGGAIGYIADRQHGNIVNCHDKGRYIQQSYYSGPKPFGKSSPHWPNWPWNPITAGDDYGHSGEILKLENDGKTLYVKSVPKQWALNDAPGECIFETWITLDGNTATVRQRLTNKRPDKTDYGPFPQELPALYTAGKLCHLFTYTGNAPFTGQPLTEIHDDGRNWAYFNATECWAELVDSDGWGLGVCHPGIYTFAGGFRGRPNSGGPFDNSTGYIAPVGREILDYNIVYEYRYYLVVGKTDQIRDCVYNHCERSNLPDYRFLEDRQHWTYENAGDDGFPIMGALKVHLDKNDPIMVGPEAFWQAADVPRIFIKAAYHCKAAKAEVFFKRPGETFAQDRSLRFDMVPDGQFHIYPVDLSSNPKYTGAITGIRFDPIPDGSPGEYVEVAYISYRRYP